ncbi:MAG: fatty acid desaturase [Archangium gephyra]|uniref:Fatty acid desaturase n=1 Tax=Archangium gephyra TaxID=48 RepID=A0A2W5VZF4_9BACT|nr:MAG: fatty acid desaturase [Archangium gephyra]
MTVPAIVDPQAVPQYAPSAFQTWIESMLHDKRDAVFFRLWLKNLLIIVPLQVAVFVWFSWWLAVVVWVVQIAIMAPPAILMLHNTMHRPFVKSPRWLNRFIPFSTSLMFGIPTGYLEHHVGMHHAENNLRSDLSSTMTYQRDSILNWLVYFSRFLFLSHVQLTQYFLRKKRPMMARRAIMSDAAHVGIMAGLAFLNWRASLVAFIVPYFFMRLAMMWGNWGQHAFIDASRPGDSFVNSITCINTPYNTKCFNDGYHIGHHVKQTRHWTEMPQDFLDNQERYAKEGCIVFEGIDFFMVSLFLFLKRYDWLARRFVRLPGDERTDEQVIEFLKGRTRRISDEVPDGVVMNA